MARPRHLALLLALPLLLAGLAPALAGDEELADPIVARIIPVGALTTGRTDHGRPRAPTALPSEVNDEEHPLFGYESEEPFLPLGTVDELIEQVKNAVRPLYWEETRGADIRSLGAHTLVVLACVPVLDQVARFLADLEAMHGTVVTVDVHAMGLTFEEARALRAGGGPALDEAKVAALLASPDAGPSVSVSTYAGSRAAAYAGVRRSWVADADVEVCDTSTIADPIVMVANLGLSVDVRPVPSPDGRTVLIGLDAALSELAEMRDVSTGATGTLEVPVHNVAFVRAAVTAPAGAWVLADGGSLEGGRSNAYFLVRATPRKEARAPGGFDLPTFPHRVVGPMQTGIFPIPILTTTVENRSRYAPVPVPSNYRPPEPPELPEPMPICPEEAIVELVFQTSPADLWEDPASMEVRNRALVVRNTAAVLRQIGPFLDVLRQGFLWSMDTTIEVVEAPQEVARHLGTGGPLDESRLGLLAEALASGQAVRLDAATVTSLTGARNTVLAGRLVSYVQDYNAEIAQDAAILDPDVRHFFEGLEADVRPVRTTDGEAVQLSLRILCTRRTGPMRTVHVTLGAPLDLPEVETLQLATDLVAPVGRTSVAATWGGGGRCRLLLVTPTP